MVTSFFPGRIRLRAPIFKDEILVARAKQILEHFTALKNLEHNPVTGSVLIEYEPEKVPVEELMKLKDFFMELSNEAVRYNGTNAAKILKMLEEAESKLFS